MKSHKIDVAALLTAKKSPRDIAFLRTLISLLSIASVSLGVRVFVSWVLSSYFRIDVPGSLMYKADDGWCEAKTEGIGIHCFGDFNERLSPSPKDQWDVYPNNLETTPIGPFITSLANFLSSLTSPRIVLVLFYLVSIVFLLFPLFHSSRRFGFQFRIVLMALFGMGSYPFLVLMDRLNYLALAVPFLYFLFIHLKHDNNAKLIPLIVSLSVIKPQFGIIALMFLFRGKIVEFLKCVSIQLASISILIVIAGKGDLNRLIEYIRVIGGYGGFIWDVQAQNPPNASIPEAIYQVYYQVSSTLGLPITQIDGSGNALLSIASVIISLILLLLLYKNSKSLHPLELAVSLTIVGLLGFGVYVATYYLIFLIPLISVFLTHSLELFKQAGSTDLSFNLGLDVAKRKFLFAVFFSSTTLIIPVLPDLYSPIANTNVIQVWSPTLATFFWIAYIVQVSTKSRLRSPSN